MHTNNLHDLLVEELKDLYDAEKQISATLPKLANKAKNLDLRFAFQDHLEQTKGHLNRLEEVFTEMNVSDRKKTCKGMKALIQEGDEMIENASDPNTRDAILISTAQRMDHYEMAGYGTVVSYAQRLDHNTVADLLQQILNEEKQSDLRLSQIAETQVNALAAA